MVQAVDIIHRIPAQLQIAYFQRLAVQPERILLPPRLVIHDCQIIQRIRIRKALPAALLFQPGRLFVIFLRLFKKAHLVEHQCKITHVCGVFHVFTVLVRLINIQQPFPEENGFFVIPVLIGLYKFLPLIFNLSHVKRHYASSPSICRNASRITS